jgi:hypothetical protein
MHALSNPVSNTGSPNTPYTAPSKFCLNFRNFGKARPHNLQSLRIFSNVKPAKNEKLDFWVPSYRETLLVGWLVGW